MQTLQTEEVIRDHSEDTYLVPGGYKVKGITLLGETVAVGFLGNDIIFRHTKPCFGFFALRFKNEAEEIKRLRDQYIKDKNVMRIK